MQNSCRWEGKNEMWLPCPWDQALSQKLVIDCDPASGVRQVFSASTTPHCDGYVAFCAHAILANDLFEVPDAAANDRFSDNPLVTGQPDIRFYAGAPIRLSDGMRVGTLCVIDLQPRVLTHAEREVLLQLSVVAARALESRVAARKLEQATRLKAESDYDLRLPQCSRA